MLRVIEKHKKKLMAVFGVALMVVFILPSTLRNSAPERHYGYVGEAPLPYAEVVQASNEWKALTSSQQRQMQLYQIFGPELFQAMKDHPELWALLKRNAQDLGFVDESEELEQVLVAQMPNATRNERRTMARALASEDQIRRAFIFVASLPKASAPRLNQTVATQFQVLSLSAIEFTAHARLNQVAEPTAQEIDQQIATYGNTPADEPTTENPFGFGYQFPSRIKAQYVVIPESEVRRVVLSAKDDYQWDVQFRMYYQNHPQQFPTTAPAPLPALGATTAPASQPAAKPLGYDDYKAQIKEVVIRPLIDTQMQAIQNALTTELQKKFLATTKTTQAATTAPTTQAANFADLQDVQRSIEKTFKITLTIHDEPKWQTETSLRALPVFGDAFQLELQEDMNGQDQPVELPALDWLFTHAQPLASESIRTAKGDLPLFQASTIFRLTDGSRVIFRVADAHTPRAPLAEERDQVVARVAEDLRVKAAYELTLQAATKVQTDGAGQDLAKIAQVNGRNLLDIGPIRRGTTYMGQRMPDVIAGYDLPEVARPLVVEQAYDLLKLATDKNPHPIGVIQIQHQHKCLLVQLQSVKIQQPEPFGALVGATIMENNDSLTTIQEAWFSPENIHKRMNYRKP